MGDNSVCNLGIKAAENKNLQPVFDGLGPLTSVDFQIIGEMENLQLNFLTFAFLDNFFSDIEH